MPNERERASVPPTERAQMREWWKNEGEGFQAFLLEWSLTFVQGFLEKVPAERVRFAAQYVITFRQEVKDRYGEDLSDIHSDEAILQILLITARKRVDKG